MFYLASEPHVPPEYRMAGALQLSLLDCWQESCRDCTDSLGKTPEDRLKAARTAIEWAEDMFEMVKKMYVYDPEDAKKLNEIAALFDIPRRKYRKLHIGVYGKEPSGEDKEGDVKTKGGPIDEDIQDKEAKEGGEVNKEGKAMEQEREKTGGQKDRDEEGQGEGEEGKQTGEDGGEQGEKGNESTAKKVNLDLQAKNPEDRGGE